MAIYVAEEHIQALNLSEQGSLSYWYSSVFPDNCMEEELDRLYRLADDPEQDW